MLAAAAVAEVEGWSLKTEQEERRKEAKHRYKKKLLLKSIERARTSAKARTVHVDPLDMEVTGRRDYATGPKARMKDNFKPLEYPMLPRQDDLFCKILRDNNVKWTYNVNHHPCPIHTFGKSYTVLLERTEVLLNNLPSDARGMFEDTS